MLLLLRELQSVSMSQTCAVCPSWLLGDDVVMFDKDAGACWTFDSSSETAMGYAALCKATSDVCHLLKQVSCSGSSGGVVAANAAAR